MKLAIFMIVFGLSLVQGDMLCTDCEKVVTNLVNFMTNFEMEGKIQTLLDNDLCAKLDENYRPTCELYVMALIPPAFSYIKEQLTPQYMCSNVTKLCPGVSATEQVQTYMQGNLTCQYCKLIANEIRLILQLPILQERIEGAVVKVCAKLPVDQDTCSTFVDTNSRKLFDLMDQFFQGSVICPQVGFCEPATYQILVEK